MYWKKLSHERIKQIILEALAENMDYRGDKPVLGIPGTYLDPTEFYPDAPSLKDAPYMSALVSNPNHIGVHTLGEESVLEVYKGTQKIERELIHLVAEQIFRGKEGEQDGYVATGGTEANIQAIWMFRNYFRSELGIKTEDIALIYSEDSHYSMPKAANLLNLHSIILGVNTKDRQILQSSLEEKFETAITKGFKAFIIVANLSTTMFGSVDDINRLGRFFTDKKVPIRIHVDAAYGGFIYPFTNPKSVFTFDNPYVSSIAADGHKMLQTPYGTGIFLCRKGLISFVKTNEARYIPGKDYTLSGSRSGANAVSIWMILNIHGSEGWRYKMETLCDRTERICKSLGQIGIKYFRDPHLNIIAIKANQVSPFLAKKYYLVADTYEGRANWYKIVVMPHVKPGTIDHFLSDLEKENQAIGK